MSLQPNEPYLARSRSAARLSRRCPGSSANGARSKLPDTRPSLPRGIGSARLLAAVPPASRPKLLRGTSAWRDDRAGFARRPARAGAGAVWFARAALYLNETGDPRFDSPMIEHNGILAAADWEPAVWDELLAWFAGLRDEADELHVSGSLRRLPEQALEARGLDAAMKHRVPSYSVDLCRLADSGGELYPVLSANARQQLRRACRHFERFGPLRLAEAATVEEALSFFDAMKALHCASWERRGRPHAFTGGFFEPFHRLLIERSFAEGGTQLLRASAGEPRHRLSL